MRLTRIYTPEPLQAPGRTTLHGTAASHVARVLRLRVGDAVVLFNGDGWEYAGRIAALPAGQVEVELLARDAGAPVGVWRRATLGGGATGWRIHEGP